MTMKFNELFLSAREILAATGGKALQGGTEWFCRGLSTDTRTLQAGSLFVALTGERFDGHDYLATAADRGASGLVIAAEHADRPGVLAHDLPVIAVADPLVALGAIAREWRRRFAIPVLAITGSAGKTTTKEMVTAIASATRPVLSTSGNLNNQIGLPLTLLELRSEHELAVIELGTNSPGEMAKLSAIALPDIGLITNIGPAHLEGLGTMEGVREEKGALFARMGEQGKAILNADDPHIQLLAKRWTGKAIRFGFHSGVEVTAAEICGEGSEGVRFLLLIAGHAIPVRLMVPGLHNVKNALAAAAAAHALGFSPAEIAAGLTAFRPIPGRMEIHPLGNGVHLIMDAYNANPASVREALFTLQGLKGKGRSLAVLGDMLELGSESARLHEEIGALTAQTGVGRLFLKGQFSDFTARGARKMGMPQTHITFFTNPEDIAIRLKREIQEGDWILVKGSRRMKLEEVAEQVISLFDLPPQTL